MEIEVIKDYINVDKMAESLFFVLRDARDNFKDGRTDGLLDDIYSDGHLRDRALMLAVRINDDMMEHLHMRDHSVTGSLNNVDYDYSCHVSGKAVCDHRLVDDLVMRLDKGRDDERTRADRDWLVGWFLDTFGTYGIKYNFQCEMSEALYQHECEMAEA